MTTGREGAGYVAEEPTGEPSRRRIIRRRSSDRVTGGDLEVDQVSMVYRTRKGDTHALDRVSFAVREGEFVSLIGPSGCGKSTLLMIAGGLQDCTSGHVVMGGEPVRGPVSSSGIVFQADCLVEWRSAIQNVLLQAELRRLPKGDFVSRAQELLTSTGLAGFENAYPQELSGC